MEDKQSLERGDIARTLEYDDNGTLWESETQEMYPFLKRVERFQQQAEVAGKSKHIRHGMHMPANVYWEMCQKANVANALNPTDEEKKRIRLLLMTDYRKFVVDPGAIARTDRKG